MKSWWNRAAQTKAKPGRINVTAGTICNIFSSPESFLATPTFTLSALPAAPTPHLWSRPACWIFLWENGTAKRGLIYILDHTDTDAAPPAKLKLKKLSRGRAEGGKMAQLCWFKPTGDSAYASTLVSVYAKICKNWNANTHAAAGVWADVKVMGAGEQEQVTL